MGNNNSTQTGGFWMETEPLYPELTGFNPAVIYPEKGVVFMRTDRDFSIEEKESHEVKVIAI